MMLQYETTKNEVSIESYVEGNETVTKMLLHIYGENKLGNFAYMSDPKLCDKKAGPKSTALSSLTSAKLVWRFSNDILKRKMNQSSFNNWYPGLKELNLKTKSGSDLALVINPTYISDVATFAKKYASHQK